MLVLIVASGCVQIPDFPADAGEDVALGRDASATDGASEGTSDASIDALIIDGPPCGGVCNTPPPPQCVSTNRVKWYEAIGTCQAGVCVYPYSIAFQYCHPA